MPSPNRAHKPTSPRNPRARTKPSGGTAPTRLDEYRQKRDFATTAEPSGLEERPISASEHRRFVIQKHDASRLHYDLRLEVDGTFKSWAVTRGPSLDPHEKRLAVEVEDHPLAYGDFEGTIPEGEYGGGSVMIWDRGFWAPETDEPVEQALAKGELKFVLAGDKLNGGWVLVRLKPRGNEKRNNWLLIKHRDRWAIEDGDDVLEQDRSIASRRTMEAIAAGTGREPEPFMTKGGTIPAGSIWDTSARSRRPAPKASPPSVAAKGTVKSAVKADPAKPMRLTHPDRVMWPASKSSSAKSRTGETSELTKQDLADYLTAVAPWMIRHVYGRPSSLLRAPEGITGPTFFQRHPLAGQFGKVSAVRVDAKHEPYLQIDDEQTLIGLAQFSVLEIHPWNSTPFQPHVPERLIFDLDPAPDVLFPAVVEAALELRGRMADLGLAAFCKTTGGKGLHVVVPLSEDDSVTWEQAKLFTQSVASQMASDAPTKYLTTMTKSRRTGRIYLDYLRNDFTATAVAPLSPRARPGALVSMPLNWPQVRRSLDPSRFTILTAPRLLEQANAWADYDEGRRPLVDAIRKHTAAAT